MTSVILVIHLFLALAIIGLVLLQRSEGGGLTGTTTGGLGGLATPQGTANILTRATAICAAGFFATSLALGSLAAHREGSGSILDQVTAPSAVTSTSPEAPEAKPPADSGQPPIPQIPSAPIAK